MAMVSLFAATAANRIYDRAIQVHGAMGLTHELRFVDGWEDVRSIRIALGTDEILRRTIAKERISGKVHFEAASW
jgi:acyl-CoA dehydrogenase